MKIKPKVIITFQEGGQNGGPYISHKRIMESSLKDEYNFVQLVIKKPKEQLKLINFIQLVGLIKKEKADIFHFTGLQLIGFVSLLAAKIAGCKRTICAVHGSSMEAINFCGWKRILLYLLENWTLNHCTVCYGVSNYVANWKRMKRKNCFGFIYNLYEFDEENNQNENIREKLNIPLEDIVILSTGRITEEKGYDILTNVIINGNFEKNIHFIIVGDGDYLQRMKDIIMNNQLKCKVHLLGYQKNVTQFYKSSDIFILCTKHETLGNSIIEACHNELPVIVSNVGGIPEIVENYKNGFLVREGNIGEYIKVLTQLIKDKQLRQSMGKKGKEIIEMKFNRNDIVNKIKKMYEQIV